MANLYILNTETLDWPIFEGEFRLLFPNTSFSEQLVELPEPYVWVVEADVPTYDQITQGYREATPTKDANGNWMRTYEVYDLPEDQVAANEQAKKDRILKGVIDGTQTRLDDFAKTRNYDGILSLATYATSTNAKFQTEGQYGVEARDLTWAKLYEIMAEVEAGTRPMPESFADVEPELPALEWPTKPEELWSV